VALRYAADGSDLGLLCALRTGCAQRCSPWGAVVVADGDETAGLAGLGVTRDGGHDADGDLRVGQASRRRLLARAAVRAAWSRSSRATKATSMPVWVWRTWYSVTVAAETRMGSVDLVSGTDPAGQELFCCHSQLLCHRSQ
jgi:hypothetical protein